MLVELLLIQFGTFIVLILVLRFLFYKHLNSALRRLRELQEEALIKESQIKEELERIKQERIAEVQKGREEAKRIVESSKKDGEAIRGKIETEAKEESLKIISFGKDEVQKLRQELLTDIKTKTVKLAIEMIKSTFTEKGRENLQRQLMDELITEVEKIDKDKFTVKTDKISIQSSFPLNEGEKKKLKDVLEVKLGYPVVLEEKNNPDLISGLIIQMNEFIIDGSLINKLNKVVPYLHSEI